MRIQVIFRNIENHKALISGPSMAETEESYLRIVKEKLQHLEHMLPPDSRVHASVETNRFVDTIEVSVFTPRNCYKAHSRGESIQECLAEVERKLTSQILKKKERLLEQRFRKPYARAV